MDTIENLNSTNNVTLCNGSLATEVYLKKFLKGFLLNLLPISKHVSYAIAYSGTPLIINGGGRINKGFFFSTRKRMAVFDRRPKKVAVIMRWP